jgi:hypothetical protein
MHPAFLALSSRSGARPARCCGGAFLDRFISFMNMPSPLRPVPACLAALGTVLLASATAASAQSASSQSPSTDTTQRLDAVIVTGRVQPQTRSAAFAMPIRSTCR